MGIASAMHLGGRALHVGFHVCKFGEMAAHGNTVRRAVAWVFVGWLSAVILVWLSDVFFDV